MWYDLTKCIYVNLTEDARTDEWLRSARLKKSAEDIIEKINGALPDMNMLKWDDFTKFKTKMRYYLEINREIGEVANRDSQATINKFGIYTSEVFNKKKCIFYYFLLNEVGAWRENGANIYNTLLKTAGISYSPSAYESMEDVITACIIETDNNFERWLSLMNDWHKTRDKHLQNLQRPFMEENTENPLTLNELDNLLENGRNSQNNTRETRMSINQITDDMEEIMENQNAENITELFNGHPRTIELILDAETRRQWYFLQMIYDIIDLQKDDFLYAAREGNAHTFEEIKGCLWTANGVKNANMRDSWGNITIANTNIDKIRAAIEGSYIVASRVEKGFEECLTESQYAENSLDGRSGNEISRSLIFEKANVIRKESIPANRAPAEDTFRTHIFRGGKVTKEFLLLTVLVAFANGIEYTDEYIYNHILYNSRYPVDLNEENIFTKFYKETIEGMRNIKPDENLPDLCFKDRKVFIESRKNFMRRKSSKYLVEYFDSTQRSLFRDILIGHEIS